MVSAWIERIVGVDLGLKGAFSVLTFYPEGGADISFHPMPCIGSGLDLSEMHRLASSLQDAVWWIETPQDMGRLTSRKTLKRTHEQFGLICGFCGAFQIKFQTVTPSNWSRLMHQDIPKKTYPKSKQRSLIAAHRLYPKVDLRREGKKFADEGFVDALLIATYGATMKSRAC